jgi:hypothetical protein
MIAAIMAMLMTAMDPAPPPAAAADPSPAPQVGKTPLQTARDNLDQAQQIYTQSCGDRAYGAYDDLCEQLSTQLRQYRIDLDKLAREGDKGNPVRPKLR